MQRSGYRAALIVSSIVLSACAQLGAMDMRNAKIGMTRQEAIASMAGNPTPYLLKKGSTEYVLFRLVPSFTAMYSDHPHAVYFIRLENDKVVDRGLVGKAEEKKIRQVNSTFVLREWQAKGPVSSDGVISNSAPSAPLMNNPAAMPRTRTPP